MYVQICVCVRFFVSVSEYFRICLMLVFIGIAGAQQLNNNSAINNDSHK